MGTSMASVSFRWPDSADSHDLKPEIRAMFQGIEGIVSDLEQEQKAYAIVSPYGDMGMFLQDIPQRISALTGDYAVFCMCVDSDFALLELYHNGGLVEKSALGIPELLAEIDELADLKTPNVSVWRPLLLNSEETVDFQTAVTAEVVFVEARLKWISILTGMPIFDDKLVYGEDF